MKRKLNVFCTFILLVFAFTLNVEAKDKEEIIINSITQNDIELKEINGYYQVNDIEQLIVKYTITNPTTTKNYKLERSNGSNSSGNFFSGITGEYQEEDWNVYLNYKEKITSIIYKLYDNDTNELLDTKTIFLEFTKFDEYNFANANLYITNIKQGNNDLTLMKEWNNSFYYEINKIQDLTYSLKGENFNENITYLLYDGYYSLVSKYTGKQLNDGIEITRPLKDKDNFSINLGIKAGIFNSLIDAKPTECKTLEYCYLNYKTIEDNSVGDHNINLIYSNYKDKKIKSIKDFVNYYQDIYIVSSKYHNENNPLSVNINGKNYLDKDYNVNINIMRDNTVVYTKDVNVNGLLLNSGYNIELDNFVSSKDKTYIENKDEYIVKVNIDKTTSQTYYMYGYEENYSTIDAEIFFENGKKNLSTFRGDGSFYYNSGFAETNKDAFLKYNNIYLRYVGNNFENNLTYDYEFSYGYSDNIGGLEKTEILKTGKINGKLLNTIGLMFAVDNKKNYKYPTYRLEVKYKGEIIYYSSPVIELIDTPTLANVSLTNGNNKDLYLRMDDYTYIATRNFPMTLAISGIGFIDDEEYKIAFSENYIYENDDTNHKHYMKEYTFKGKDLNDGKAIIKLDKKITSDITSAEFYVSYQIGNSFGQGGFRVNFVNSKDLLSNAKKYFIDNASDLIKNITKNTSVEDFINNIGVLNNGKIKIYDTTGTTEITENVGTGMIARVIDGNNNNLLDLDVVVKGDVTGDGNISITDLVRISRDIAKIQEVQ